MRSRSLAGAFCIVACAGAFGSACGSSSGAGGSFDGGLSGIAPTAQDGSLTSTGGGGGGGTLIAFDSGLGLGGDGSASASPTASCASTTQRARQLPLDLYLMLDTSGSMDDLVAPMKSKWSAVSAALSAFASDPASAGIGVAIQTFPRLPPGIPPTCTTDAECGGSPCFPGFCQDSTGCHTDADCTFGKCYPFAACSLDANTLCALGASCKNDANGFPLGNCVAAAPTCGIDDCVTADYSTPAVPFAALPGAAPAINAFLGAHQPSGATPTPAALRGAIEGAKAYASANAGHTVVAVLATDGLPNEDLDSRTGQCAGSTNAALDTTVANIAAAGLSGTPSVKTFAIGVFTPNDAPSGTTTLNGLAAAGGSKTPFIIQTMNGANVEQQFVTALNAIRGQSLPCAFALPKAEAGMVDFAKVNAEYVSGSGAVTSLGYVEQASSCTAAGGWYYDSDPAQGGVPTTLDVCPSTCSVLRGDPNGAVNIVLGCATQILVPR